MTVTNENVDMNMDLDEVDFFPPKPELLAEKRNELGNQQYKLKQYGKALVYYSEAIDSSALYGNRSGCHTKQGNYAAACDDALKAVTLNPKSVKGWVRVANSNIVIGEFKTAENAFTQIEKLQPNNLNFAFAKKHLENAKNLNEEADKAYAKKEFRKVVYILDRALKICNASTRFKIMKAECLARLGRYQQAQELADDVLSNDKQNADAFLVRGMCFYYQDNVDRAFSHFQHVLKLAPDYTKAMEIYKKAKALKQKKEEGNKAFNAGKNKEAYDLYSEALGIDPNNVSAHAKLYFNRATVSSRLGRINEAISDCSAALKLDPTYLKALLRRAKCYMDQQQYEEAIRDYEKILKIDNSRETIKLLSDAKLELKKSQRKDYYKILGINKNAKTEDIKKAYRKRALVHHPDRHANASDVEKQEQEKKFKEVGQAYTILSDPEKRTHYDNGFDFEDYSPTNGKKRKDRRPNNEGLIRYLYRFKHIVPMKQMSRHTSTQSEEPVTSRKRKTRQPPRVEKTKKERR